MLQSVIVQAKPSPEYNASVTEDDNITNHFSDPSAQVHNPTGQTRHSRNSFIVEAGWLITMNKHLQVLREHSLVVENGRITACLTWTDALSQYPGLTIINY